MFSFKTFHRWTKKQIEDPLSDILKLLKKNRDILTQGIQDIETQIEKTQDPSHS